MQKTIIVFTGGGLAPALNATLYGVITAAKERGYRVLGGFFGWKSLTHAGTYIDLTHVDIGAVRRAGGTFLRSSRTNIFALDGGIAQLKRRIAEEHIDAIVAIGGDDTLGAAERLFREENMPTVGIPKTIDNDLSGTYWTPGFPTAAQTFGNFVREIRDDAAYTLQRVFVLESYGMKSGWLVSSAAFGGADIILPPERPVDTDHFLATLQQRYEENGKYAVVAVSENTAFSGNIEGEAYDATDTFGHVRRNLIAVSLRRVIKEQLGLDARVVLPGNFVQTGPPIDIDGDTAEQLGRRAVALLEQGAYGMMPSIERLDVKSIEITIGERPLTDAVGEGKLRTMDDVMFDFKKYSVKQPYLDYMEPMLGKPTRPDAAYHDLLAELGAK